MKKKNKKTYAVSIVGKFNNICNFKFMVKTGKIENYFYGSLFYVISIIYCDFLFIILRVKQQQQQRLRRSLSLS